jgi:SEC-C motif-containing protein
MTLSPESPSCPCGSGKLLSACCQSYLRGDALPTTAEALMRSRYSAFVMRDADYLLKTWHPDTRPQTLLLDEEPPPKWLELTIKRTADIDEQHAEVEFVARYKINGRAFRMHETSRFVRIDGRWFYREGELK